MTDLLTTSQALILLGSFGFALGSLILWAVYEHDRILRQSTRSYRFTKRYSGKSRHGSHERQF